MNNNPLSDVTPIYFLQTFILEFMLASEQQGQKHCEALTEHIAKTAGCFFEEAYRSNTHEDDTLDIESYTELILSLKNNIGGKFSLASSVFGGIAARNFGYAKVEIKQSIASLDGKCEVCLYQPKCSKRLSRHGVH